jgi:predicted RNA-binding protein with PUA-like domain
VAGVAEIVGEASPDPFQFDTASPYHDPKADPANPPWLLVQVGFVERFAHVVSLDALRSDPALEGLLVTRKGQRLSVMPVDPAHFERIVRLGRG